MTPEVRGGPWCWGEGAGHWEALAQEQKAWEYFGATPRNLCEETAEARQTLAAMEARHGGCDPTAWKWGPGTPCVDVHAADEAMGMYRSLRAKVAAYAPLCERGEASESHRSRSPRR